MLRTGHKEIEWNKNLFLSFGVSDFKKSTLKIQKYSDTLK